MAFGTGTTITTGTTVAITTGTAVTLTAWAAGCALTLDVAFGLGLKRTHRQAELAGLLVDLDQLDLDLVALLEARCLHVFETLPRDLADVEQTVAVWHKLDKRAKIKD